MDKKKIGLIALALITFIAEPGLGVLVGIAVFFYLRPKGKLPSKTDHQAKQSEPVTQPNTRPKKGDPLKPFYTKVAGVSHDNPDGSSRQSIVSQCKVGEQLILMRELDNEYDPNAVKVCRKNGQQLGYLPADVAEEIAHRLDNDSRVDCVVSEITGGGGRKSYGCNIQLTKYRM